MFLLEGAKVSQRLVNDALSDPSITMGFEAEFYLDGVGKILEKLHKKNTRTEPDSDWVVKPLKDMQWYDLMRYFRPINFANQRERTMDDQELIRERLRSVYESLLGETGTREKYSTMFDTVREKYKPYHILALLKVWPASGFVLDLDTQTKIQKVVKTGNAVRMTAYKDLDNQVFRTYERGEEELHFNAEEDLTNREVLYQLIADALQEFLGEPVVATVEPATVRLSTEGYTTWAVTMDDSLMVGADGFDRIGIEVVSPIKTLGDGIEAMLKLMQGLNDFGQIVNGLVAETTERTGFHIGIGAKDKEIDFVKLLFLMGDEYVAQNYDRLQFRMDDDSDTSYAAQTYADMLKTLTSKSQDVAKLLGKLEGNISLNQQDIEQIVLLFRKNTPMDKMYSVNLAKLPEGYVEFRSPGNVDYHKNMNKLAGTARHLGVMLYIATEPRVYRKEFLTKLYKTAVAVSKEYLERVGDDIRVATTWGRKPGSTLPGQLLRASHGQKSTA